LVAIGLLSAMAGCPASPRAPIGGPSRAAINPRADGSFLLCSWNVENFYDDQDDSEIREDEEDWFGSHPDLVTLKVERLASALLAQNDGLGPDLIALVEVESQRALELLRNALNRSLPTEWRYSTIAFRPNRTGRNIAPGLISRLPLVDDPIHRDFGIRRILGTRVVVDGQSLILLITHWTSRLTDGTDEKRSLYADIMFRHYLRQFHDKDATADVLICGDFNDNPDDASILSHLRAVDGVERVRRSAGTEFPLLLNLMASRDPDQFGTYFYSGRWQIFDQIVVSPGLLDSKGWQVLPETTETFRPRAMRIGRDGRPWRFGNQRTEEPRGYSDHFPVSVRLRVVLEEGREPRTGSAAW
jgi:endonuclease/exonuclease/phosphatase family metal-dependent hydrolase